MLNHKTSVHDSIKPGFFRQGSRAFIDYAELHPDAPELTVLSLQLDRLLHDRRNVLRGPENIDQLYLPLDLLRNIQKTGVAFFAQDLLRRRVDRDNSISVSFQVSSDLVPVLGRIFRHPEHGDCPDAKQHPQPIVIFDNHCVGPVQAYIFSGSTLAVFS